MKRSYCQICGVSKALDLVGERWTLLIVRDLLMGPSRYGELLERLEGITTNLLAKRLREMQELGLVEACDPGVKGSAYRLTPKGGDLEELVFALGAWGFRHAMSISEGDKPNLRWALLSAKRSLGALGKDWSINFECEGKSYFLCEKDGKIDAAEGSFPMADLVVRGESAVLCPMFALRKAGLMKQVELEGEIGILREILNSK